MMEAASFWWAGINRPAYIKSGGYPTLRERSDESQTIFRTTASEASASRPIQARLYRSTQNIFQGFGLRLMLPPNNLVNSQRAAPTATMVSVVRRTV